MEINLQNLRSFRQTYRALRKFHGTELIRDQLMTILSLLNNSYPNRARAVRIEEFSAVDVNATEDLNLSI